MKGFEIVEAEGRMPKKTPSATPATQSKTSTKGDMAMNMLSDNFENILNLASSIVEVKKMKVASDACLAKMAEDRKMILAEAEAYATRIRADTSSIIARMNVIRAMMQDFYAHSSGSLSGDEFHRIISEIVNTLGKVEDGLR